VTVSDGVSPSPKGGGRSRLAPLNPPLFLVTSIEVRQARLVLGLVTPLTGLPSRYITQAHSAWPYVCE